MIVAVFFIGLLVALSVFLSIRALFGGRHARVQATLVASPFRSLAVGAATALALFGVFVGMRAPEAPPLVLIGIMVAAAGASAALFGLAVVAASLGERVLALRDGKSTAFAQTAVGTTVLALAGALPFLGWFLIAPVAMLLGLGAVVMTAARKQTNGGQPC